MKTIILSIILTIFSSAANAQSFQWNEDNETLISFVSSNKTRMLSHLIDSYEKGAPYRKEIERIFREKGVPIELYALASIESNYSSNAVSHANAVGMWQIMRPTGLDLGLIINNRIDERKNWIKSTEAAADYLKHMALNFFDGNYELAILAYNAGPGTVLRAITKNKTTDPWVLIQDTSSFRKESREYLPQVITAIHIFKYIDSKYQSKLAQN